MKKETYRKLLNEVFGLIDPEDIKNALSLSRSSERVDCVQDLIRASILKCPIGKYKGTPYFFNGKIYEEMFYDEFGNLVYDLMKKCKLPHGDYSRVEGVIKVCRRVVSMKELRPDRTVMVFKNCVLDTKTRTTHKFSPDFIQMTSVDYNYNKDDLSLQWTHFLDEVLPEKKEQKTLQEALGCLLINRNEVKLEHIVFLFGSGANGKSVVFETVMGIFGRENISNYPVMSLVSGADRKKNIASMDGLWVNYSTESQIIQMSKHEDAFKALISGEPTEARQIYGENFMAYNIPLQMVNINKLPEISKLSNSLKRRLVIINFGVEIPVHKQNKQLAQVFRKEYSGILNWIIDGRDRFIKNKYEFTERASLDERTDDYQAECNPVMKYMLKMKFYRINKDVVDSIPKWVSSGNLYDGYARWCNHNDITPETNHVFGMILSEAGYIKRRTGSGNEYAIYGNGIVGVMDFKQYKMKSNKQPKTSLPYYAEGRMYVNGYSGLARVLSVSNSDVSGWIKLGLLEQCYTQDGRVTIFDVEKVKGRLKRLEIYKTDKKKEIERLREKHKSGKRGAYNQAMKHFNSPDRMYKPKVNPNFAKIEEIIEQEEKEEEQQT